MKVTNEVIHILRHKVPFWYRIVIKTMNLCYPAIYTTIIAFVYKAN